MYNPWIIIFIVPNINLITLTHSNTIITKNISTSNILVYSLSTLLDAKTMVPYAKIICTSAASNSRHVQMMKDLSNGMAIMHQARWYQFVHLTIHQFDTINGQRANLMLFDELDGMRYKLFNYSYVLINFVLCVCSYWKSN